MVYRKRKPNRREEFDYGAPECYFVTLCTYNRQQLFDIEDAVSGSPVISNGNGIYIIRDNRYANQIIHKWLAKIPESFDNVRIRRYVVMPDHLHLFVDITEPRVGGALPDVMQFFKSMTTNEYINCVKEGAVEPFDHKIWQRSYHDHIIRDYQDYHEITEYIKNNPREWLKIHGRHSAQEEAALAYRPYDASIGDDEGQVGAGPCAGPSLSLPPEADTTHPHAARRR